MQLAQGGVEPLREVRNAILLAGRNHEIDRGLRPRPPSSHPWTFRWGDAHEGLRAVNGEGRLKGS